MGSKQFDLDEGKAEDRSMSLSMQSGNGDEKDEIAATAHSDIPEGTKPEAEVDKQPPPPPNGGYGWVITGACATINANTWGVNSSYGVFLAHYLANTVFPEATRLDYAFIGGLSIGAALLTSPIATMTVGVIGTKPSLLIGVAFETASLIGASFAWRIWQLYLSQGLCFGIGMGFLFVSSVGLSSQYFTTRRSLANGICAAGSGLGGLIWSLGIGAMIRNIGLGWAFRITGIVTCASHIVCIILIKDRNKLIGSTHNPFDIRLFKRAEYVLLNLFGFFSLLGYVVLIFSLSNYANTIGLSANQAALISALFNLGQAIGRPPVGYFSDNIGRLNMAAMMTALCGVWSLVIWLNAHSFGVLILFALLGGSVAGTYWAVIAPVTAEVVGLKSVPGALNMIWLFIAAPSIFSEPIALEIIGGTGSYLGTILFTVFMYFAAAMCMVLARGWKIQELAELERIKTEGGLEDSDISDLMRQEARRIGRKGMLARCWKWAKV